jgi:hypothetical protein
MPQIISYDSVVQQAGRQGLACLYPNSGAFGFPAGVATHAVGWTAGDDASLRPAARLLAVTVAPPAEPTLASLAARAWQDLLPGDVWVLPKAHWAYELDFGSGAWLPDLLRAAGVDPAELAPRHDGSAVTFAPHESASFAAVVQGLLSHLFGSDFQLVFPSRDVVCTVHHHKQLWWTSPDAALVATLREMPGPSAAPPLAASPTNPHGAPRG